MQRYTIYLFLWNALHVSGRTSAHHQELKIVYTASGTCQTFTAACRYIGSCNWQSTSLSIFISNSSLSLGLTMLCSKVCTTRPTGCTIYFQFISLINFYMFRAGLLLIIRRYYSVHTTICICHSFMLTGCCRILPTASQHKQWNKMKVNKVSSLFLLYGYITMYC
jgi:hypothetical protein